MSDGDAFWDNLSKKIDDVYDNPSLSSAPNSVAAAEKQLGDLSVNQGATASAEQEDDPEDALQKSYLTYLRGRDKMTGLEMITAYQIEQKIGAGTYGKVYRATHKATGYVVAIKTMEKARIEKQKMTEKVNREMNILELLSQGDAHPHVCRLYECIETEKKVYMVLDYCPGGDFFDFLAYRGSVTENEARALFLQILSGVEYCHKNKIVHRDLKPENLLIDGNCNVKIADFSLANTLVVSKVQDSIFEKLKTSCGSPNYAAPEIVSGVEYFGRAVDIWSLGVILYSLVCGTLPFDDENPVILFRQIKSGKYPPLPAHVSDACKDLLAAMLAVDPAKRSKIEDIRANPWLTQSDGHVDKRSLFAYAPMAPPMARSDDEDDSGDDSDSDLEILSPKKVPTTPSGGQTMWKSGSNDKTALSVMPGELVIYYQTKWARTYLHHTVKDVSNWTPLPGGLMTESKNDKFPGSEKWRVFTCKRELWGTAGITFAFNDGQGTWDNNGNPFKNYHVDLPGEYWIDPTGNVVPIEEQ